MLTNTHELAAKAKAIGEQAARIDVQAREVRDALKGFRDWTAKAVANATEVHEAVKAKLDEDHATLVGKLGEMAGALDDIIQRLEGVETVSYMTGTGRPVSNKDRAERVNG